MKNIRYNFNTKLNKEEHDLLLLLKERYAVNISQAFKLFLKSYYEKMLRDNGDKK